MSYMHIAALSLSVSMRISCAAIYIHTYPPKEPSFLRALLHLLHKEEGVGYTAEGYSLAS